jgi:hypothetical protein
MPEEREPRRRRKKNCLESEEEKPTKREQSAELEFRVRHVAEAYD